MKEKKISAILAYQLNDLQLIRDDCFYIVITKESGIIECCNGCDILDNCRDLTYRSKLFNDCVICDYENYTDEIRDILWESYRWCEIEYIIRPQAIYIKDEVEYSPLYSVDIKDNPMVHCHDCGSMTNINSLTYNVDDLEKILLGFPWTCPNCNTEFDIRYGDLIVSDSYDSKRYEIGFRLTEYSNIFKTPIKDKPITTEIPQNKKETLMAKITKNNKDAAISAGKMAASYKLLTVAKNFVAPHLKAVPFASKLMDGPLGDIIAANVLSVAAQYYPDNKIMNTASEMALKASYYELLKTIDISSLFAEVSSIMNTVAPVTHDVPETLGGKK